MLAYVFVFCLGAIIGSFLNVVILRLNTGESIARGGSRCFGCGKGLKWYELVPIASFLVQKGKCRSCGMKISWQYPAVEAVTGLLFLLIFYAQGGLILGEFSIFNFFSLVYYFTIFSLLIVIAAYDIRHQIIPNGFVYSFIFLSVFAVFFESGGFVSPAAVSALLSRFLAGAAFFSFFALLWFFSKGRAMGFGDAKLALGIGFFLGLAKGAAAILVSFWSGAILGVLLLMAAKKRYNMRSRIAFGPFLVLGTAIAFFAGDAILRLYF